MKAPIYIQGTDFDSQTAGFKAFIMSYISEKQGHSFTEPKQKIVYQDQDEHYLNHPFLISVTGNDIPSYFQGVDTEEDATLVSFDDMRSWAFCQNGVYFFVTSTVEDTGEGFKTRISVEDGKGYHSEFEFLE